MQNFSTRKATEDDIPLINSLAQKIWRLHYPSIISLEQIEYMLEKMYSTEALSQQLLDGHHFEFCFTDKKPIGYCSYSRQENENYFLHKMYIDTTQHHKGIGTWFFKQVFGKINDIKNLRLTVNRKNHTAINFYFKNGFIIEEVKDFDIGKGFWMNDFVMLKKYSN